MENLVLQVSQGQLCFGKDELIISDNVNNKFTRIGLSLLCLAILVVTLKDLNSTIVTIKALEKVDSSFFLLVASFFALLFPVLLLYIIRNNSDFNSIKYKKIEAVKYKKTQYGFKKEVLEISFKNEQESLKKRHIHINHGQIKVLMHRFEHHGIKLKV
jgi:hypothetical protein